MNKPPTPAQALDIARQLRLNWGYAKTARLLEEWAEEQARKREKK